MFYPFQKPFFWQVTFSPAFDVIFLLLTSFTVYHAIRDCLSSELLILSIWTWMYSVTRCRSEHFFCIMLNMKLNEEYVCVSRFERGWAYLSEVKKKKEEEKKRFFFLLRCQITGWKALAATKSDFEFRQIF